MQIYFQSFILIHSSCQTSISIGKRLDKYDIDLHKGLMIKGKFNIQGLRGKAEVKINFPNSISVDVTLDSMSIGIGMIALRKSKSDPNTGAQLRVRFSYTDGVTADIQGYVSLLKIGVESRIVISDEGFKLAVEGNIFGIVAANLSLKAAYGSIESADFMVNSFYGVWYF